MQKAEKRLHVILRKYDNSGIPRENLAALDVVKTISRMSSAGSRYKKVAVVLVLGGLLVAYLSTSGDAECFVEMPLDGSRVFREPESCDICGDVDEVAKVENISTSDFESFYAAKSKPVVVTDGARGWSAVNTFGFDFFRELYRNAAADDDSDRVACQFFPYKTEFRSLIDALSMSRERSRLAPGTSPWYIGWSNCNDAAGDILRRHYSRPYFLPKKSENIALNWIFMGGPGLGAHMHVDNVRYPSWQAQLRGRKVWTLAPPPECFYKCHEVQVTVEPGEIIVVDTNRWYHKTQILPGDISITIGAEFD